ncbi:protease pro-enzyme activation domain-containing protein [Terriglobus albidus]|uniref:protease pro-enzyme activation domain-containing protein n=1 Tax=Terriglobus albidus TaxID=1592106 RepID=UPI0021DFB0E3|nr:protease pro-enzyme activation domain-containing protein [Terriglobus albidus]
MARSEQDAGRVPSDKPLSGLALVFSRTEDQENELQALLAAQQNPSSSQYHQWLSPDEFAARFGVADSDIEKAEAWLQQQGFTVTGVARGKNRITFSGTVGQVESAFGTQLHYYKSGSQTEFAPSTDISLPAALSSVVQTVSNLSSFRPKPHVRFKPAQKASSISANFTSSQSGSHFLSPKDVATIYDINPVYNSGYKGSGQAIAVVGQSDVQLSDIEHFQSAAGFTVKDPTLVLVPNSGSSTYYTGGDEAESDLDLEYTSTIAPEATIYFVYTGNNQNYGVFDALQYAIDTNLAPIISVSYGECETALGSTDYKTYNGILAQAASQGQTVVVAAGDSGSTDCYEQTSLSTSQRQALAVDFPASSQYVTGMGGTEFPSADVSSSNTTYWESAGGSDVVSSAKSYVPEQVWNDDSSSSGLSSGGGGISTFTSRPSWQTGVTGISSGSYRLVPDISLDSSPDNAGYLFCSSDSDATGVSGSCSNGFRDSNSTYLTVAGGTSFASPIFSGMMALINQKLNSTGQGVINSTLYQLASSSSTYASAFHDITSGSNACTAGSSYCSGSATSQYAATTGYDEATGLGSIDFYNLFSAWPTPTNTSSKSSSKTTLTAATTSPSSGANDVVTITVASGSSSATSTPTGTLSIAVDGTTVNSSLALTSGTAAYTFSSTTSGTHVVSATYSGDSTYASSSGVITLTIGSTSGTTSGSGGSGSTTVTATPSGGFTGTVSYSLSTSNTYLQQYACYDLSDASVTGTSAVSETLTIYLGTTYCANAQRKGKMHGFTQVAQTNSSALPGGALSGIAGIFAAGLVCLRRRRLRSLWLLVLVGVSMSFALTGCGSSNGSSSSSKSFTVSISPSTVTLSAGSSGVPTGTYSVTIKGTSGSLSSSTTLTLTVN